MPPIRFQNMMAIGLQTFNESTHRKVLYLEVFIRAKRFLRLNDLQST